MDYQNRAGSKKGSGGIASDAQQNLQRRKQVEQLLKNGEDIPYSFQNSDQNEEEVKLRRNPYIYKNHSGKFICKLCNTMHMSWSSVERHINGKKHGINLLKRGGTEIEASTKDVIDSDITFRKRVDEFRLRLRKNGIIPKCKIMKVKNPDTGKIGIAVQVLYPEENSEIYIDNQQPLFRIISGLELPGDDNNDKKYIVIAFEPFENIAIDIPNNVVTVNNGTGTNKDSIDDLNSKCAYWDKQNKKFYIQLFFDRLKTEIT